MLRQMHGRLRLTIAAHRLTHPAPKVARLTSGAPPERMPSKRETISASSSGAVLVVVQSWRGRRDRLAVEGLTWMVLSRGVLRGSGTASRCRARRRPWARPRSCKISSTGSRTTAPRSGALLACRVPPWVRTGSSSVKGWRVSTSRRRGPRCLRRRPLRSGRRRTILPDFTACAVATTPRAASSRSTSTSPLPVSISTRSSPRWSATRTSRAFP